MSETPPAQDDIQRMLREAQHGSEITDEFARICLRLFRDARAEVVTWNRTLGRRYFLEGQAPEAIKRIVEQDIEQARADLRERLTNLPRWARMCASRSDRRGAVVYITIYLFGSSAPAKKPNLNNLHVARI